MNGSKVSAYLRVKDEINTIEACLKSIDGIFDRIVIIHSNENDDGTVEFMHNWAKKHSGYEIYEYPHFVLPAYSSLYNDSYDTKNSLAAYNNFGLSFFEPEEWVCKIDADQVYFREALSEFVNGVKYQGQDNCKYALRGYNTFIYNNCLVKYAPVPLNGMGGDSYCVKRKNIDKFYQNGMVETIELKDVVKSWIWHKSMWFHFMKNLKFSDGTVKNNDFATQDEIEYLTQDEIDLFEKDILPLLKNSKYNNLKFFK